MLLTQKPYSALKSESEVLLLTLREILEESLKCPSYLLGADNDTCYLQDVNF